MRPVGARQESMKDTLKVILDTMTDEPYERRALPTRGQRRGKPIAPTTASNISRRSPTRLTIFISWLKNMRFTMTILEHHRRQKTSVGDAMIEMRLANILSTESRMACRQRKATPTCPRTAASWEWHSSPLAGISQSESWQSRGDARSRRPCWELLCLGTPKQVE